MQCDWQHGTLDLQQYRWNTIIPFSISTSFLFKLIDKILFISKYFTVFRRSCIQKRLHHLENIQNPIRHTVLAPFYSRDLRVTQLQGLHEVASEYVAKQGLFFPGSTFGANSTLPHFLQHLYSERFCCLFLSILIIFSRSWGSTEPTSCSSLFVLCNPVLQKKVLLAQTLGFQGSGISPAVGP